MVYVLRSSIKELHCKNDPARIEVKLSQEYSVDIDFDEASSEWRRNKKQLTNGTFVYVCGMSTKNGKPCQRCESHRRFHRT